MNGFPTLFNVDVTFSDADLDMAGGKLTVQGGTSFENWVLVMNLGAGHIGEDCGLITFGGVDFAEVPAGGGTTTVTFDSAVTAAAIETLIENLTPGV